VATERMSMRKTKEILRMKWVLGLTHRDVARSLKVGVGTVTKATTRAEAAGLDWAQVDAWTEDELEQRLYAEPKPRMLDKPLPDCAMVHAERSRPGVTLELLHQEYLERHPDGYRYTQFCEHYRAWVEARRLSMRHVHVAGEKLFVDYSGKKASFIDQASGRVIEAELFVAVMGASSFTFAEATLTQSTPDWIGSHGRLFAFLGGVPAMLVPDQLKSGVTIACRYEPIIQRTYEEMAEHYGTSVVPARPRKPRDKAKVEAGVLVVQRWILARLRNQTFFSLQELNERISELLVDLNSRRMRKYEASRQELFDRIDRAALKPLPSEPFVYAEWKKAKVNIDYHVEYQRHFYSVPSQHRGADVEIRASAEIIEVYLRGERIASHRRSRVPGRHTTVPAHMAVAHQKHSEWSPSRLCSWGGSIGPATERLVAAMLADRPHPEQGYRSCLGLLRLAKRYGNDRLEKACARAFLAGARSYQPVKAILEKGLDKLESDRPPEGRTAVHENVRGGSYYN
jgi:transposase